VKTSNPTKYNIIIELEVIRSISLVAVTGLKLSVYCLV
jgi:hypothetical protein